MIAIANGVKAELVVGEHYRVSYLRPNSDGTDSLRVHYGQLRTAWSSLPNGQEPDPVVVVRLRTDRGPRSFHAHRIVSIETSPA